MKPIEEIAQKINLVKEDLSPYGPYIAKVKYNNYNNKARKGKLILVTAINPTKAGEGKTTCSIGIADMLNKQGYNAMLALREPSLGPVFGLKGSATGGGECIVMPENDINLHFTGDFHAITSANNLVSAMIDNVLYWNNELNIDPNRIVWQRCLDVNDRALRDIEIKIKKGLARIEHFQITAASEIMAILCLSKNLEDLRERLDNTIVAYTFDDEPVFIKDLKVTGSLLALLKNALEPNLVQTKYYTPALVHLGPFANISHGTNSVIATDLALKLADYVVTEAGFGADLGFEKFNDIVNTNLEFTPQCVVLVTTIKALKLNGFAKESDLDNEDLDALAKGMSHLEHHLRIIDNYNLNRIVCINRFAGDTDRELDYLIKWLEEHNIEYGVNETYAKAINDNPDLVEKIVKLTNKEFEYKSLFNPKNTTIKEKIDTICQKIYQTTKIEYSDIALEKIQEFERNKEYRNWPVCMAKFHQTIYGNKDRTDDNIFIRDIKINSGAKYFIVYLADIITLPGLNRVPNAVHIDVENDEIVNIR